MNKNIMVWFAPAIITVMALLLGSCAAPRSFEQAIAETYRPSTSSSAFTRAEAKLKGLHSGDALTAESLGMHFVKFTKPFTGETTTAAYAEGWIPSMSGGGRGAVSGLGRSYGLEGNTIYGRHVFGYVYGNITLVPKYELRTRATVVPDTEYEEMKRQGRVRDIFSDAFGKDRRTYFFKDVKIDEIRSLPFQGAPEMAKEELKVERVEREKVKESLFAVHTKASFEDAETQLKRMKPGTDWWGVVHQMEGFFMTNDFGGAYALYMKGYANYEADYRWQLATKSGVYEVWPFGYVENGKEVFRLSVIFRNGKLDRIVPYEPEASLAPRLRE